MLLLTHQTGSVRVGEVVRYTLTYIPSADRILPTPTELHVKIRNTSAIPLRAAYLHGPYTLNVSCRPSTFDPNHKFENHETEGIPQFEPNLKAGGTWDAKIPVPERIHATLNSSFNRSANPPSLTWVIEIVSEVIFSTTATVQYEVLVGRDEKSTLLGATNVSELPSPGHLRDHTRRSSKAVPKQEGGKVSGVYSDSVKLRVDDTATLWSTPRFPSWDDTNEAENTQTQDQSGNHGSGNPSTPAEEEQRKHKRRKKVHFVVLTHGLHSNLGADMLYLKENIDKAAKEAREDSRKRKQSTGQASRSECADNAPNQPTSSENETDDEDEEEVIVRGFPGNAAKTEKGVQYLGKRLAKYVQLMTYPDQPYLPPMKGQKSFLSRQKSAEDPLVQASFNYPNRYRKHKDYAYKITSISFVGHSLGGLIQTYAIAYIQKHSPEFFNYIKPVNFVALASPFLGLSNENPLYVKFALDFGLVGRTGQDLGLTWNAPSKVRSGWEAMIGGLGNDASKPQQADPGAKPLLRILPNGPAHYVLKKFRNRTLYCNVVNDGIVPLRTSCLLFLDWRGLERVGKARRENGLVGTMAEWGWAQLAGVNATAMRSARPVTTSVNDDVQEEGGKSAPQTLGTTSGTQSPANSPQLPSPSQFIYHDHEAPTSAPRSEPESSPTSPNPSGPFSSFVSLFRYQTKSNRRGKHTKIYNRGQTLHVNSSKEDSDTDTGPETAASTPRRMRGNSFYDEDGLFTPPKTTFLESAGNVLSPPLPTAEYIIDPSSRARTIFHDRVYHPEDIPMPPPARPKTMFRASSNTNPSRNNINKDSTLPADHSNTTFSQSTPKNDSDFSRTSSGMRVEEKIARAYHRDLTWRKVLVQLEPDAHNNIIVRRMFSNAYGWPVIKHLVDTHFGYTATARESDELELLGDRAKSPNIAATEEGEEVIGQHDSPHKGFSPNIKPTAGEETNSDENDTVPELNPPNIKPRISRIASPSTNSDDNITTLKPTMSCRSIDSSISKLSQADSAQWTDSYFVDDGNDESGPEDVDRFDGTGDIRAMEYLDPNAFEDSDSLSSRFSSTTPDPTNSNKKTDDGAESASPKRTGSPPPP